MYKYLTTSFLFLLSFSLTAQQRILEESDTTLRSTWDLQDGQFSLGPESVKFDKLTFGLSVTSGDLKVNYTLPKLLERRSYQVETKMKMFVKGAPVISPLPNDLDTLVIKEKTKTQYEIVWTDVVERNLIYPGDSVTIRFNISLVEKAPRELKKIPPEFKFKQKWPHYAAFFAGAGLLSAGVLLKQEADDIYDDQYKQEFFESPALPLYKKANDKHHQSLQLIYAGGGILLIDAVWFTARWLRHKSNKSIYRFYYQEKRVSLKPAVIPGPGGRLASGFQMKYSF